MYKLSTIANNIQKQKRPIQNTTVAVITDVTAPLYRQKQGNYIVMLKVVDQSLNDQQLFGVMSKDCSVYLIAKRKKDIEFVKTVGEIVLLDKFTFMLWNGIKLQTKYLMTIEGIYTVSIDPNNDEALLIKDKLTMNPDLLDISPLLIHRVKVLMEWRSTALPQIYQPKLGVNILNSHCVMIQAFNMILSFEDIKPQQQHIIQPTTKQHPQQIYTLILKDNNQNIYTVRHNSDHFQPGDLVFVRGIQNIGQALELILTQTGNVLRFAYQVNRAIMNYMGIYRDNEKFIINKKQNQFTVVNCQNSDTVYISQLLELQDRYNHSSKKQQIPTRDSYIVKVVVINYEGYLSMYHRDFQIVLHEEFYDGLSQEEKKEYKQYHKIGYVYEGVLGLIDRSNQSKGKPFYANIFTCDISGNFLPSDQFLKAQKNIGGQLQKVAKKQLLNCIDNKLSKIASMSSFENLVSVALEPIRSEKLLFRLANTKIIC